MRRGTTSQRITFILGAITLVLFVSYIWFASTITSLGYKLDNAEKELQKFKELESEFIVELANRQNPEYIQNQGEQLRLVEIKSPQRYIDTRTTSLGRVNP